MSPVDAGVSKGFLKEAMLKMNLERKVNAGRGSRGGDALSRQQLSPSNLCGGQASLSQDSICLILWETAGQLGGWVI